MLDATRQDASVLPRLNGFTRAERLASVSRMREAIVSSKGWIIDFSEFSNLSICLRFQAPGESWLSLIKALRAAEIKFSGESELVLAGIEMDLPEGMIECSLQVLFVHNEPDFRRKVLAIPG